MRLYIPPASDFNNKLKSLCNTENRYCFCERLFDLKESPGIYMVYEKRKKKVIYVGKTTTNLKRRLWSWLWQPVQNNRLNILNNVHPLNKRLVEDIGRTRLKSYYSNNCFILCMCLFENKKELSDENKRDISHLEHFLIGKFRPKYNY